MLLIDTNLLVLLIVGLTNPDYIAGHRRLHKRTVEDFDEIYEFCGQSDEIVVVPHILAEVSNLTDQPYRRDIRRTLRRFIETTVELQTEARVVAGSDVFDRLGLTDAVILHVCTHGGSARPTLLTTDEKLANAVISRGGAAQLFAHMSEM